MDEPEEEISPYALTIQEDFFRGGGREAPDPYVVIGLVGIPYIPESKLSIDEIIAERKRFGMFKAGLTGSILGLKGKAVISLSDIDSEGRPLTDPKILGSWDPETKQVITYPDRDLTREFVDKFRESGLEIPMREIEPPRDISRI